MLFSIGSPYLLTITRDCKPVIVIDKSGKSFSCVADAAQAIVDLDRMGIELVAIAKGLDMTSRSAERWRRWPACLPSWNGR